MRPIFHTAVRTEREGDVLVIIIDNPPINAGSLEVRRGLLQAISTLQTTPDLQAGVLIGSGNTFMAGSDLREFGKPLGPPELPAVIAAIEACSKPVVAAQHWAVVSSSRWVATRGLLRLTRWSVYPKWGWASFRAPGAPSVCPRVGVARAIQMICSGERIASKERWSWA